MKIKNIYKLVISLLIPQLAGGIGSIFTARSVNVWYPELSKPSFNPPNWVFGPVWTALFLMMGYSLYLIWTSDGLKNKKYAYFIFAIQLVLNVIWSVIFFGFKDPGWAFVEILFLILAIMINIFVFYNISRKSAWFLVPYLVWVVFAAYLNYSIWTLN